MPRNVSVRRQVARGVRRLRHGRPALSVVVLVDDQDPERAAATIDAVRDQPSPRVEILVVPYAGEESVARAAAAGDTRVRVLPAQDLAGALRRAARASRGEHVLVSAPGDLYPHAAL